MRYLNIHIFKTEILIKILIKYAHYATCNEIIIYYKAYKHVKDDFVIATFVINTLDMSLKSE